MALDVNIVDGHGSGKAVKVNGEGEIGIVIHTHPPIDEDVAAFPFRQFLTSTGISTGSIDMIVDGSTTPQLFYVKASQDRDIFIKSLSFRIGDATGVTLAAFGGISALGNGCSLTYSNDALGEITIADALKTNIDLVRLGTSTGAVGTGTAAYKLDISGGGAEDSYLPFLDLSQTFGFPWGLRLKKNSNDKLIFTIRDALAGLVTFNCIAYGTQV
jgi:hypothetical protein